MRQIYLLIALLFPIAAAAQSPTNYQQQGLGQTALDLLKQVVTLNTTVAELQERNKGLEAENAKLKADHPGDKH